MNRRRFLLGGLGLGAAAFGAGLALRPRDRGAPHKAYFATLEAELQAHGPMRPCLLIDLDRLDHNIAVVATSVARGGKQLRIVEKSLPCAALLRYAMGKAGTERLMSFHQPFLNQDALSFPTADILLGKPLPVRAAAQFYAQHRGPFDPSRQLQWLIDTPERAQQYLALAQRLGSTMRMNVELNVGLHRGGVAHTESLAAILKVISANPAHLQFSGFMGYDPFVGMGVPTVLGTPETLLAKVLARYQAFTEYTRAGFPALWSTALTLNTAGSPSYRLHETERLSNDISVGTGLLKPSHYDLPSLAEHQPAVFIATPVLKATGAVRIPALDERSQLLAWWDVNQRETFFIYGGNWLADYASPEGLQTNALYGRSSNQEMVNASATAGLKVDDQIFLRPTQTESVLTQFGDILAVRAGKIIEHWPVYPA